MTVKKVERVYTGDLYLHSFKVSLIFFALMVITLHFLYPSFNIVNPSKFDEVLTTAAFGVIPLTLYLLNRPYRSSISWTI